MVDDRGWAGSGVRKRREARGGRCPAGHEPLWGVVAQQTPIYLPPADAYICLGSAPSSALSSYLITTLSSTLLIAGVIRQLRRDRVAAASWPGLADHSIAQPFHLPPARRFNQTPLIGLLSVNRKMRPPGLGCGQGGTWNGAWAIDRRVGLMDKLSRRTILNPEMQPEGRNHCQLLLEGQPLQSYLALA